MIVGGAVLVVVLAGAALWSNAGGGSDRPPTDAEARAYFDRIVAAARARDWDKLCSLNGANFNCRVQLDTVGRESVPPDPPTIVETRFHDKQSSDGTPGRLLVVEGVDGRGERYHSEVLIFRYDGQLEATNAVYWGGFEIFDRQRNEQRLQDADQRNKEQQNKQGK
jgi:hypothetical protein